MYKNTKFSLIIVFLILIVPTAHMAMPLALALQKTLVFSIYGYNFCSFALKNKWFPKSMRLKNKEIKDAKKEKKEIKTHVHFGLMQLLTNKQKEIFVYQNEMCKRLSPNTAADADKNACALMMLCFSKHYSKPLFSYQ